MDQIDKMSEGEAFIAYYLDDEGISNGTDYARRIFKWTVSSTVINNSGVILTR